MGDLAIFIQVSVQMMNYCNNSLIYFQVQELFCILLLTIIWKMLGLKPNKVQAISSVSLAGLPTDTAFRQGSSRPRRSSKGSLSGSLHGFEQIEVWSSMYQ